MVSVYPDNPWFGVEMMLIFIVILFLQFKISSLSGNLIVMGCIAFGFVILGVIDHFYDEEEDGALFLIMIIMIFMYGCIGIMMGINIGAKYTKGRW